MAEVVSLHEVRTAKVDSRTDTNTIANNQWPRHRVSKTVRHIGVTAATLHHHPHRYDFETERVHISATGVREICEILDYFSDDETDAERCAYGQFLWARALQDYQNGVRFDLIKKTLRQAREDYLKLHPVQEQPTEEQLLSRLALRGETIAYLKSSQSPK